MSINRFMRFLGGALLGLVVSADIASAEVGEETLVNLVKRAKDQQVRLDVDANINFSEIMCQQFGATGRICIGKFVYGIVFNVLVRNDIPILLQLVMSTENIENRKDIGRAINAFMIFTAVGNTQDRLDTLALIALSCLAHTPIAKNVGTLSFEATETGCVIGYQMGD